MNMNNLETFSTQESVENTLATLKNNAELIGKNPMLAEDYQELLKTIKNIEDKIAASKN